LERCIINFAGVTDPEIALLRGQHVAVEYSKNHPAKRITVTFLDDKTCIAYHDDKKDLAIYEFPGERHTYCQEKEA
jgi:hypothetical protein